MNTKRISMVAVMALVLVAAVGSPSLVNAQQLTHGSFHLYSTTYWANAVLPAGNYTFTITRTTLKGVVLNIQGAQGAQLAAIADSDPYLKESALSVRRADGAAVVTNMHIAGTGISMRFRTASAAKELLASAPSEADKILVSAN